MEFLKRSNTAVSAALEFVTIIIADSKGSLTNNSKGHHTNNNQDHHTSNSEDNLISNSKGNRTNSSDVASI